MRASRGARHIEKEAEKSGDGKGHTLAEDERFVDFLSVLYVGYQAENSVELAGCEGIGGGKLRIKESENLNNKEEIIAKESALVCRV